MATHEDVRRICGGLPDTTEGADRLTFSVVNKGKEKGLAWIWMQRAAPKEPRVPRPDVLAVRISGEEEKAALISTLPEVFFTEPHYNGFPAILVRLGAIEVEQLEDLLVAAWRIQAAKSLVREFDASRE